MFVCNGAQISTENVQIAFYCKLNSSYNNDGQYTLKDHVNWNEYQNSYGNAIFIYIFFLIDVIYTV